jgi:hypothetical protein
MTVTTELPQPLDKFYTIEIIIISTQSLFLIIDEPTKLDKKLTK